MNKLFKFSLLFFVIAPLFVFAQSNNGLTKPQITDMQKSSEEITMNYFSLISTIATLSPEASNNDDVKKLRIDALTYFENENVNVYNNLILDGAEFMKIERYLTTISSEFAKNGGEVLVKDSSISKSTVYYKEGFYIVKLSLMVSLNGIDNSGKILSRENTLVVYLKFILNGNTYDAPKIYWITSIASDNNNKLIPVEEVELSKVSSNTTQISEMQNQITKSIELMNKNEAKTKQLKKEYESRLNEVNEREQKVAILEAKLVDKEKMIAEQFVSLNAKQTEIDNQNRSIQKQEKKINNQEKEIDKKDEKLKQYEERLKRAESGIKEDRKNMYSYRRVLDIGFGVNTNQGTINDNINGISSSLFELSPQIRFLIGYRFDFRMRTKANSKINRGHVMGLFLSYSLNSENNILKTINNEGLLIPVERQLPLYNRSLDIEFGFLFNEFFRITAGVGSMNGYKYNIATSAFKIPLSKSFSWEIGSSFLFGQDYKKIQIHPYTMFSYQMNDNIAKKMKEEDDNQLCIIQITGNYVNHILLDSAFNQKKTSKSITSDVYFGFKLSEKFNMGLISSVGNFNKTLSNGIVNFDSTCVVNNNSNFNPYYHVDLGVFFSERIKIAAGLGQLFIDNSKAVPLYSLTFGFNFNLYKQILRGNIELSDKILNNNFNNNLITISGGLSLRFKFFR